jgi:hypothetical protein
MNALVVTGRTVSQPRDPALLAAALAAFEDNRRGDGLAEAHRLKREFFLQQATLLTLLLYARPMTAEG